MPPDLMSLGVRNSERSANHRQRAGDWGSDAEEHTVAGSCPGLTRL